MYHSCVLSDETVQRQGGGTGQLCVCVRAIGDGSPPATRPPKSKTQPLPARLLWRSLGLLMVITVEKTSPASFHLGDWVVSFSRAPRGVFCSRSGWTLCGSGDNARGGPRVCWGEGSPVLVVPGSGCTFGSPGDPCIKLQCQGCPASVDSWGNGERGAHTWVLRPSQH